MICVTCKKNFELREGRFIRVGSVMGSIPKHDFKCRECCNAIDNTSREPGCDDDIGETDW